VAIVGVESGTVLLEPNVAVEDEHGQTRAGLVTERSGRVETVIDFRGVDAEQPDAPDRGDVDGVAVEDSANQHRRRSGHSRRGGGNGCDRDRNQTGQELHVAGLRNECACGAHVSVQPAGQMSIPRSPLSGRWVRIASSTHSFG
jgi:hypothetical protein